MPPISQLRLAGYGAQDFHSVQVLASACKDVGFDLKSLRAGGYTASDCNALYQPRELREGGYSAQECKAAQALVGLRAGRRGKRLKKNATTKPGAHEKKTQPNKRERAGQGDHAHKDERGAEATSTRQKCNACGQALAYHRGWRSATEGNLWCDAPGCGCVITPRDARFSCAACDHDICSVCGVEAEGEGVANYRTRRGWGNWEGEHGHVTIF